MTDTQAILSRTLSLILGMGESGAAAARWCVRQGGKVRVADTREQPGGLEALRLALPIEHAEFVTGCSLDDLILLEGVTQVVISPGLSPIDPPVRAFLDEAVARGIEVIGEIELFARALSTLAESQGYCPRLLGVTGTNGKTTVTALACQMAVASGHTARAAGNIGPAALAALIDALEQDTLPDVWVIELSSFQLETTTSLALHAATVLNISQDHLDWHGSETAYADAKARILNLAAIRIVNRDDAAVMSMVDSLDAMSVRSFGRDEPTLVGDLGMASGAGVAWLAGSEPTGLDEPAPTTRRKKNAPPPVRGEGRLSRLMPADALRLRGMHNAMNVLAAMALVRSLDAGWGPLLRAAGDYAGEPHRAAFVRTIAGVDFINDSKGTNVGATVAALEGLGQRVVLIAGGLGKGQDFSPLARAAGRYARSIVLIGRDAPVIEAAVADCGVPVQHADGMNDAVAKALSVAEPGDAVLLSPACASMDMFKHYGHRGEMFVEAVQELALDHGEIA